MFQAGSQHLPHSSNGGSSRCCSVHCPPGGRHQESWRGVREAEDDDGHAAALSEFVVLAVQLHGAEMETVASAAGGVRTGLPEPEDLEATMIGNREVGGV